MASFADDGSTLLWHTVDKTIVARLQTQGLSAGWSGSSSAFHPHLPYLATPVENHTAIALWELDWEALLGSRPAVESVRYTTAKLVLVGDSGVGKTGLGWRLKHDTFKEQRSTHGQQFWVLDQLQTRRADGTECVPVLWDLAGQHVYRSVHALFLDDVDLSLVLFDPTQRQQPLKGVEFWLKQLAGKGDLPPAVLVGARLDRGAPVLSRGELEQFCQRQGISGGYVGTSAVEGTGIDELTAVIGEQIPWEQMATTVTTLTFQRVRQYVRTLKEDTERKKVLISPAELRLALKATDPEWRFSDAEMMTAVGHMQTHGMVSILRSSSGETHILLAPDLLVDLAASIVLQADKHPRELGAVSETALLRGEGSLAELGDLDPEEGRILLDAALERFLKHNVCFRETPGEETWLVFPGLIKQKQPLFDDVETIEDVSYIVRGRIETVYPALVVLLSFTPTITRVNQWQRQARYEMRDSAICGFRMIEEREGEIELVLYYSRATPEYGRTVFQGTFEQFLYPRQVQVTRFPPVRCEDGHLQERATVIGRIREGKPFLFCADCGKQIALPEIEKPRALGELDRRRVGRSQALAHLRSAYETHLSRIKGFRRGYALPRCYVSYMPQQADWVERLVADLHDAGVLVVDELSEVQESDFVIVVGTPGYRRAWERAAGPIAADARLIRARLERALAGKETAWPTVVPLLQQGSPESACPTELHGREPGDFRDQSAYVLTLFDLVLTLYAIALNHVAFEPLRALLRERWEQTLAESAPGGATALQENEDAQPAAPPKVFVSYAREDETFKDDLLTMLSGLQRRGVLEIWDDRQIAPGDEWAEAIQEAMEVCELALLLVSPDFIASRFIQQRELPDLLARRKKERLRVVPVIVRPSLWRSEPALKGLQALPEDGKPVIGFKEEDGARDQVWVEVARAIESLVREAKPDRR